MDSNILNRMVEYISEKNLSLILKAVSDETRRSLLTRLCQEGPCRVTDLAAFYKMSLNAISKHLKILENAGLASRQTIGREHWISADLSTTEEIENWFSQLKSIWLLRLENLESTLGEDND